METVLLVGAWLLAAALAALAWRQHRALAALTRRYDQERAENQALAGRLEQLQAEAGAQRAALIENMGEGVLLLDRDGRVELFNRAFAQMFQVRDDLRGRPVLEALRSHELDEVVRRTRETGQVLGAELELRSPEPHSLQINAALHGAGAARGMILVFHDLTRLRRLENLRKEFVANVSHELRTPLSLIKGYAETLLDHPPHDSEQARRFLQIIVRHADRLTYLIEDLLTLSSLESGTALLNPTTVALRGLVARAFEDLAARATERGVTLVNETPEDLEAYADADRVLQVLFNLLDNAIKYGRPQGRVVVGGRVTPEDRVEMWVRDDGPGLPREALGRVFERFYRVDRNRSREQGGTGLGLAIVKHIVQSHGGEVRVESEPGQGATFYFTLPRRSGQAGVRATEALSARPATAPRRSPGSSGQ
jgi:two-component system phosphate regulon sensor histidine kinase PhoR